MPDIAGYFEAERTYGRPVPAKYTTHCGQHWDVLHGIEAYCCPLP